MVSKITEKIIPEIREWQNRPLEKIYPFIFMDAIHYKIKDKGKIVNKAAYVVLGINIEGYKDVLGIWIRESESSKFWQGRLNDLKTREIRKIIYTTNIIEEIHRQFRKVTKTKSVFPNDTALEKMLYLATKNVVRKWTQRYRNWDIILNQLLIMYPERLSGYIN